MEACIIQNIHDLNLLRNYELVLNFDTEHENYDYI